jgi:hypothetical protein
MNPVERLNAKIEIILILEMFTWPSGIGIGAWEGVPMAGFASNTLQGSTTIALAPSGQGGQNGLKNGRLLGA